jgi:acetyltransferase-like isoleucine patch superfamily enzyme
VDRSELSIVRAVDGDVRLWNESAAAADAEFLLFVTADIPPRPEWVSRLIAFARTHPEYSAVGVRVTTPDGRDRFLSEGFATQLRRDRARKALHEQGTTLLDRSTLPAIGDECLLVRARAFAEVGGFDSRFKARGALLDLCLKLFGRRHSIGYDETDVLTTESPEPDPAAIARDAALLKRRWGVERASSPDALWVSGRAPAAGSPPPPPSNHYAGEPDRAIPPFVELGHRSFVGRGTRFLTWTSEERIHIGPYCSLAPNVTIFCGGNHSTDLASTYAFEFFFFATTHPTRSFRSTRDTIIGADVWIGEGAMVSGGVHVGHGAVIGARSTVLEDVPPYAIVTGHPAKVVRFRFSQPTIDALLRIAWWEWPEETIKAELEWFLGPINEFVARFDVKGESRGRVVDAPRGGHRRADRA